MSNSIYFLLVISKIKSPIYCLSPQFSPPGRWPSWLPCLLFSEASIDLSRERPGQPFWREDLTYLLARDVIPSWYRRRWQF